MEDCADLRGRSFPFMSIVIGKTFSFCIGNERPGLDGQPVLSGLRWVGIGPYTQAAQLV